MNTPDAEPASQPQPSETALPIAPIEVPKETAPLLSQVEPPAPAQKKRDQHDANVAPDLRTPLHGIDLILLAPFYFVSGTALYLLTTLAARYVFGISAAALENSTTAKATVIIISQALLSAATLAFLFLVVRARSAGDFWPAVGWRPFQRAGSAAIALRCFLGGLLLAAVTGFVGQFVDRNVVVPMDELFQSRQSVLLMMAMGILIAPVVEETIFRGCIYPILARRIGIAGSVVTTGILFGLMHGPQLWPGVGQIAIMMGVGLALTYVRARAGTVTASFCVHLGYNSAVLFGYYFATGGLHHLQG